MLEDFHGTYAQFLGHAARDHLDVEAVVASSPEQQRKERREKRD